ncbi:MAG: T9SS type B sorting domain-containing protein [Labilibaculum antarcticum]
MKRNGVSLLLIIFLQLLYLSAEAKDFYWISGSGNFNDIQHWSDQPGGKINPGALLPDKDDNVYFDEFSFPDAGAEVVITSVARCLNMHWGNVQNTPTLKTDNNIAHYLVIYGGVKFNTQMIIDLDRPLYFRANTLGNVIDFGGNVFNGDFFLENNGGWRITSDMNLFDNTVYFNQGSLSIEANLTCGSLVSENPVSRELYLNSATINLDGSGTVLSIQTDNLNLYPGDSKIIVSATNSTIEITGTKRVDFYDVLFTGNNGVIESSNILTSFHDVNFDLDGSLQGENDFNDLTLTAGQTYSINNGTQNINGIFTALGECYAYINLIGDAAGGNISATAVNLNHLKVQNINASGDAIPFVANNSYNLGGNNNVNWTFNAPPSDDYIWLGTAGDGKWGTPGNWNSGCVPSRNNNAIIGAGYTVEIDVPAECKSLSIDDAAILQGSNNLGIFGSLSAGNCTWVFDGETQFDGDNTTNTIAINSVFIGPVSFIGDGEWTVDTDITVANNLELFKGKLHVNGNRLTVGQFISTSTYNRELDLTNSNMDINDGVSKAWNIAGSNFALTSSNSEIKLLSDGAEFYNNTSDYLTYGSVVFNYPDGQVFLTNEGFEPTFESLEFKGNAKLFGSHQFDQVIFTQGKSYLFSAGSTQKISVADGLIAHGTCSEYISFKGDGGIAFFDCDVSSSDLIRLRIEDVNVKGGYITSGNLLEAKESIGISGYDGWFFPNDLTGTTIKWTGNIDSDWFTAGNWEGGCLPNRLDDVVFDDANVLNSYEVNISKKASLAECHNMTWTNANSMSFTGDQPISIFGSLDFSEMLNANYDYSGDFYMKSENPATIDAGAVELISDLLFEGTQQDDDTWLAGTWTLTSALKTSGLIRLEYGGIVSNDQEMEAASFLSPSGNTRSLTLGSSTFKLERFEISPDGFTFDAGTSEIIFTTEGNLIISNGAVPVAFNNVTFEDADGNSHLKNYSDDVSFNNLVFNGNTYFEQANDSKINFSAESIELAIGKTYVFESGQTYIFGDVIANGACEGTIDITASRADQAIFQAKTGVANITVNSVNILNVKAEPTDVFVAKASINLGGADGWKFEDEPAGTNLYWVDGTGNWDDPNHWSTISGIKSGGCVPTAKDNVFFDDGSFTDTEQTVYTGASDIRCRTMDWTGSEAARPFFEMGTTDITGVYIYGSLIFNSAVEIDLSPMVDFYFRATELQEINSFGYVFPNIVEFDGNGGEWKLLDNLQMEGDCFIRYGKLITDGNVLECKSITSTDQPEGINSRSLDIQNSNVIINGKDDVFGFSLNLNLADFNYDQGFEFLSDNSTITFTNEAKVSILGTATNNINFNNVVFEKEGVFSANSVTGFLPYVEYLKFKNNGNVSGNNKFGTVELGRGFEFKFQNGKIYKMDYLLADGSCFAPISLHSDKDTKQTTILAANNVTGNFLELKDINGDGSGGATYTAANSFDLGNVTGWITDGAIAPIALYWTGNGTDDSWDNHENWSRAEDGSEEGCKPTLNDDVFFTSNSFLGSKLVELTADGECHNMTWYDDVDPGANFTVDASLRIGGFMDLTATMSLNMRGAFDFVGDGLAGDKIVDFANKSMDGDVIFNGDAQSWIWNSSLITSGDLYLESGSVNTGGNKFTVGRFSSLSLDDPYAARKFDMSDSQVTVTSDKLTGWNMKMNTDGGLDFIATDTEITFANGGGIYCETDTDVIFGFVDFMNNGIIRISGDGEGSFGAVKFFEQGQIYGVNTFTNLEFTLGYENNIIESGKTITVINELRMEGVRCSYAFLKASIPGSKAYINKPSGHFKKIYNASLTDISGSSGSGGDHPVRYKYDDNGSSTGFYELTEDLDGDGIDEENPPSFESSFEKQEWCSNIAIIDNVKGFPINSSTTFQWFYSIDGVSYVIKDGETNAVIEVTESGFYKVKVMYSLSNEGSNCEIESIAEVLLGTVSNVSLEITANNVKCYGEGNGRIIAKVKESTEGNYPAYTFLWEDEAGTDFTASTSPDVINWESTALNLTPGKYNITVKDSKSCEFDTIVNIFDAYELLIDSITPKDLTCFTIPTGEILVAASGGTGNLSYFLDNVVQASENITGLYSGDYKVHVSDVNLCLTPDQDITLNSNPEIVMDLNGSDLLCYNDSNGKFDPIVTGGVPDYTYVWTGPAGYTATTANISGLAGGTYELTVTDNVNCPSVLSQLLVEPQELIIKELVIKDANCNGEESGEIFVEAAQGTPEYTYSFDGEENTTGLFSDKAPKDYILTIVDSNFCELKSNVTIAEPGEIGFLIEDIVFPTCKKTADGIILITPYGGNSGYKYSWSGPSDYRSYSQNIENIESGDYSLLITDKNNCSSENGVDLNLGLTIQLGLVVEQHIKVAGTKSGILSIETLEGTIPYSFTVTGPGGYSSVSPDNYDDNSFLIENLAAGVYTVVATDASGCSTVEKSIIIKEPGAVFTYIEERQAVGCVGAPVGELRAHSAGGDGNFTYSWSGPSEYSGTGETVSGLAEGVYTVSATSAGQLATNTYELLAPYPINASLASVTNVSCNNAADGEIELDVDFGSADYTIAWTNGTGFLSSAKHILDLEPGTYNYTVTSEYGCSVPGSATITEPTQLALEVIPTDISAEGERDGEVSATVSGGTLPYIFIVSGPNGYSYSESANASGSISVNGLEMGVYEVVVLDANECRIEDSKRVHEPAKLLLFLTSKIDVTCPDGDDGAITVDYLGESDVANLSFSWTGDHYFRSTDKDVSGLKAGTYTVTVYDSAGDPGYESQSLQVVVDEPEKLVPEFWKKNISCFGLTDGYINLHPKGGTPGYTYLWGGPGVVGANEDQQGLSAGTYSVQITDYNTCKSEIATIEIVEPKEVMVTVVGFSEPTCYGLEDGWIQLEISEGTEPYLVNWDNYGSITQDIFDIESGDYSYVVVDINGCETAGSKPLSQPDTLIAEIIDFEGPNCHGENSGSATVDISGGTPNYLIEWSDGQETDIASDLRVGTYDVKVIDEHGCFDVSSVELVQPEALTVEVEASRPTTMDAYDGSIRIDVTGGVLDYAIDWVDQDLNPYYGTSIEDLGRGRYDLTIIDQNGCLRDSTIVLEYLYENRIIIPKAFTPNNDSYNDFWDIERIEFVQRLKIVIYDRWGKAVYIFSGTGNQYRGDPWTGADGNINLPIGSYYYAVELDDEKPMMGTVTILR